MQPVAGSSLDSLDDYSTNSESETSISICTTTSSVNSSSTSTSTSTLTPTKHHSKSRMDDPLWHEIRRVMTSGDSSLTLSDLRFVYRLGRGDIGNVYLVQMENVAANGCLFAAKVMEKKELVRRNKETRARVEREILEMLDHPFLPRLYATLDCPRWSCLLTEFCPGGDLHVLRQQQPEKRFRESSVRFYVSEVIVALEYLHMMGIIYRDLKPENVLIRSNGHVMLTDFDLSLKAKNSRPTAQLVLDQTSTTFENHHVDNDSSMDENSSSCSIPSCIAPAVQCFHPRPRYKSNKKLNSRGGGTRTPDVVMEPTDIRSMSFVGTHEYLAPEIVSGEGHGSAVDWWTLGIFVFELFYGVTPFKGVSHELTLANIIARAVEFPKEPSLSASAKDLITQLLVKDPTKRIGSTTGAAAIKRHPFFHGINWALLRRTKPPYIPRSGAYRDILSFHKSSDSSVEYY